MYLFFRSLGDIRKTLLGSYTPNSRLYMPSVGETGWGQLVNQNFAILDGVSNITSITTRFTITASQPITISSASSIEYDNYPFEEFTTTSYGYIYSPSNTNILPSTIVSPTVSLRYFVVYIDGNLTLAGTIDTYPQTLKTETPPNSTTTNTLVVQKFGYVCDSLTSAISKSSGAVTMNIQEPYPGAYLDFYSRKTGIVPTTVATIPHAIAAGGTGTNNGVSGTATNTCNGGGGGGGWSTDGNGVDAKDGGTGCIFGQYAGGVFFNIGIGYGNGPSVKYRCATIFIVRGNLVISGNINSQGGNASGTCDGGFGGGGGGRSQHTIRIGGGGGGGGPVFIYYTGTYTNNGTINTAGGRNNSNGGMGGAGGIKVTKISL